MGARRRNLKDICCVEADIRIKALVRRLPTNRRRMLPAKERGVSPAALPYGDED